MPGCAAVGCNNRSEKGYIMKCFPRDPKLRKIWQERVARADWEPSNNSFLCHVHFVPQAWSITKSGRIRLKKYAVPSIFTITSTRKSPKKRIKAPIVKKENVPQNEYIIGFVENDTEYSSTGHFDEKNLDVRGIGESSVQFIERKKSLELKDRIHSELQGGNILLLINNNMAEAPSFGMELNDNGKEATNVISQSPMSSQISNTMVKKEVRLGIMDSQVNNDSYDEIEERLKQICDGGSTEDDNYDKNEGTNALSTNNRNEIKGRSEINCSAHTADMSLPVNANHNFLMKHEVGHMLADKRENVEIIFGVESCDETTPISETSWDKYPGIKTAMIADNGLEDNETTPAKAELKVFNEDIEENFTKDEVHVIPNIRAAMKRKRRTREEIMKSIKKSIRSTSDLDLNSSSNSELSESMDNETDTRNELTVSLPEITDNTSGNATEATKFIIKVTGDADDVTEIIEDLSSNTMGSKMSDKNSSLCADQENEAFVTSILTVLSPKMSKVLNDNAQLDDCTSSKKVVDQSFRNEKELENLEFIHSPEHCQPSYSRHSVSWSDEEEKNQVPNINSQSKNCVHSTDALIGNHSACCTAYDYEDLLQRVKIQEDVIGKLTDQLIIYKELECNIRNKSVEREVQTMEIENMTSRVNTRSSNVKSLVVNKKNIESKQRLIEDLSNRVNYFEEMNKKLMKTVTLESQDKRKLEGQIKQKDTRIKELNWKLEKASKYLERAEKNTNTYRRKMLNMQTVIRRKKLLDEKLSNFNDMLINSATREYTERALTMAADIKKICGRTGYDKLLSYGFPLPPLPALRKGFCSEECTDYNESDIDRVWNAKSNVKTINAVTKNRRGINRKDSKVNDAVTKASEFDSAETVTGTVQDIFDENNDGDDFSTNELREHFILQLNAVM